MWTFPQRRKRMQYRDSRHIWRSSRSVRVYDICKKNYHFKMKQKEPEWKIQTQTITEMEGNCVRRNVIIVLFWNRLPTIRSLIIKEQRVKKITRKFHLTLSIKQFMEIPENKKLENIPIGMYIELVPHGACVPCSRCTGSMCFRAIQSQSNCLNRIHASFSVVHWIRIKWYLHPIQML